MKLGAVRIVSIQQLGDAKGDGGLRRSRKRDGFVERSRGESTNAG
jgi:hypothetical protein